MLWGPFEFEIFEAGRLRKVENLEGPIKDAIELSDFERSSKMEVSLKKFNIIDSGWKATKIYEGKKVPML